MLEAMNVYKRLTSKKKKMTLYQQLQVLQTCIGSVPWRLPMWPFIPHLIY